MKSQRWLILFFVGTFLFVTGCNANVLQGLKAPDDQSSQLANQARSISTEQAAQSTATTEPGEPAIPQAMVTFQVQIPDDTAPSDLVYITILDEVTGLYLNSQSYLMELNEETGVYSVRIPFPEGSVVKYRYERQGDELRVAEHTSDGNPVRYRMYVVNGPGGVDDVVSRWTDSEYTAISGRIMGTAIDATTRNGIPNLLIAAGGAQTFTTSDGSFLIEGLPPGIHNLVGYALDGSYRTFQQGAEIAEDSTTPAQIILTPAPLVTVSFTVTPPANTPPVVPLRLAGNLYQLGNTFGVLTGGVSTLATRMPVLEPLDDGRYQITMELPVGADIHYKYTLGDGFWNAEHNSDGSFRSRQLIVPEGGATIDEDVATWETNPGASLTFDIQVPENTPAGDFVSIQFNPLFGWTEPVPMWSLGGNRWAYVLYSPLNLPGNLSYRYCRNNQCGYADDAATPGLYGAGRTVNLQELPQQFKETVDSWFDLGLPLDAPTISPEGMVTPNNNFMAGVEFSPAYHPSWQPLLPQTIQRTADLGANWLVLDPTWSVTRANPPVMEPVAGQDALWPDLETTIQQAKSQGLKVAIKPTLTYPDVTAATCSEIPCPAAADLWWDEGARDFSWWLVWFDHYRQFILHHADLAAQTGADTLIIEGDWLNPAMPDGMTADGMPSGVLSDTEKRWRDLIAEVRQHFPGTLAWSLGNSETQIVPPFLDAVDEVVFDWQVNPLAPDTAQPGVEELQAQLAPVLDGQINEIQTQFGKPLILSISAPSNPDMLYQLSVYEALLSSISQRGWISGVISSDYYPPAELQDSSTSIHGKSTEPLLKAWYPALLGSQP